jgi:acetylornithine/succinyldiaminopimelate/putrescine aminotransferase
MTPRHPLFETWDQMVKEQTPNFLRLHLSRSVAQTCFCLSRYVQETWHRGEAPRLPYQSFLANGFDEALSGAIKLARFCTDVEGRPKAGLVIDPDRRLGPLASVTLLDRGKIDFIPDLVVAGREGVAAPPPLPLPEAERGSKTGGCSPLSVSGRGAGGRGLGPQPLADRFGFLVVFPSGPESEAALGVVPAPGPGRPLVIACVDRLGLEDCRQESSPWRGLRPDIVVVDESFVDRHVPFGAFTARKALYDHWNQTGYTTFHSTTFQPNAVSTLHFMRCLEQADPGFFARVSPHLERIARDRAYCKFLFARQYNPSLARASAAVGWDAREVRAAGHYIRVNGKQVFDGVAGVACSIRGHNPQGFREEIERLRGQDFHQAAAERLQRLTGLGHFLPAVSGASAVENALRLGLAAQFPRKYVLAFAGGFGGKTLLALTGTANPSYKSRIDPLYPHVVYLDPFHRDAVGDLEAVLKRYPVGVVQLELVQAVGGVRALPEKLLRYLQSEKRRWGYLLFVDEVQTGMYRTGPFLRSKEVGIEPDLLTLGKGTSDMMFPFGVTLYSDKVQERLEALWTGLPEAIRKRFDYEFGYRTLVNVLDHTADKNVAERVRKSAALFKRLLAPNGFSAVIR